MVFDQLGLVVKRIDVTASAGAKDDDDVFGGRRKMGIAGRKRIALVNRGAQRRFTTNSSARLVAAQQFLVGQHHRQGDATESGGSIAKKTAAIE